MKYWQAVVLEWTQYKILRHVCVKSRKDLLGRMNMSDTYKQFTAAVVLSAHLLHFKMEPLTKIMP